MYLTYNSKHEAAKAYAKDRCIVHTERVKVIIFSALSPLGNSQSSSPFSSGTLVLGVKEEELPPS